jgi:hypothetical protein
MNPRRRRCLVPEDSAACNACTADVLHRSTAINAKARCDEARTLWQRKDNSHLRSESHNAPFALTKFLVPHRGETRYSYESWPVETTRPTESEGVGGFAEAMAKQQRKSKSGFEKEVVRDHRHSWKALPPWMSRSDGNLPG